MEAAMHADISSFLSGSREEIIEAEVHGLRELHAPHYEDIDLNELQLRAVRLVESFLTSLTAGPASFVEYLQSVAQERFHEGFFLEEIQSALNILGEKVWKIVAEGVPEGHQVEYLGRVSAIVGAAKDELARVYTEKLRRAESRVALLQHQLEELFAGTDSGPDLEEVGWTDKTD
jgi:hypothetical protein